MSLSNKPLDEPRNSFFILKFWSFYGTFECFCHFYWGALTAFLLRHLATSCLFCYLFDSSTAKSQRYWLTSDLQIFKNEVFLLTVHDKSLRKSFCHLHLRQAFTSTLWYMSLSHSLNMSTVYPQPSYFRTVVPHFKFGFTFLLAGPQFLLELI